MFSVLILVIYYSYCFLAMSNLGLIFYITGCSLNSDKEWGRKLYIGLCSVSISGTIQREAGLIHQKIKKEKELYVFLLNCALKYYAD